MKIHPFRFALLFLSLVLTAASIRATTFTVTQAGISGPGSLPVVINQANATPGNNTIQFSVTNTITIAAALPTITNSVTINGRTDVPTVISGGGAMPIFNFAAGTTNILSNLAIQDGNISGSGAAVNNAGTLFLSSCTISNNKALSGQGGAINNSGSMTVVGCGIIANAAGNNGGAIYNSGNLTISGSVIAGNTVGVGSGGGISSYGFLIISNSALLSNSAGLGGAIYSGGNLSISASTISSNLADGASGVPGSDGANGYSEGPMGSQDSGGGGGGGGGGGLARIFHKKVQKSLSIGFSIHISAVNKSV